MEYRELGRTGVMVSTVTLGTMLFGTATDSADAGDLLDCALDHGVNAVDSANVYGRGASEELLGALLGQRPGARDRLVLATKFSARTADEDPNAVGNSRRHLIDQCHASLRRLGIDHVDVYYIHRPSTTVPVDETLRALDDLVRAGTVRYIGTSSFAAWQLVEALWAAKEHHLNRPVVEQSPYSLLDRRVERELLPMARSYGLGVTVWSPLAGGLLTGKYRGESWPADGRLSSAASNRWVDNHFTPQAKQAVDAIGALADDIGRTPIELALGWLLAQPGVSSALVGARSVGQLEGQFAAVEVELPASALSRLDEISPPGRSIVPYYLDDDLSDWRPHRYRW
jgi:aryl-alcohol dehydrogenase-like predicted oxidoreductase